MRLIDHHGIGRVIQRLVEREGSLGSGSGCGRQPGQVRVEITSRCGGLNRRTEASLGLLECLDASRMGGHRGGQNGIAGKCGVVVILQVHAINRRQDETE